MERFDLEKAKEHADILAQCARGTFQLKIKETFDGLIKEVERLREIEDHLCMVAVDGKFSHWIDDREPEHRKKFEEIVARGFAKKGDRNP